MFNTAVAGCQIYDFNNYFMIFNNWQTVKFMDFNTWGLLL
jgi:hypothetical protein